MGLDAVRKRAEVGRRGDKVERVVVVLIEFDGRGGVCEGAGSEALAAVARKEDQSSYDFERGRGERDPPVLEEDHIVFEAQLALVLQSRYSVQVGELGTSSRLGSRTSSGPFALGCHVRKHERSIEDRIVLEDGRLDSSRDVPHFLHREEALNVGFEYLVCVETSQS